MHLDFIHKQTLVIYIILSDSTMTFSSLWALKFLSRFIGYRDCWTSHPRKMRSWVWDLRQQYSAIAMTASAVQLASSLFLSVLRPYHIRVPRYNTENVIRVPRYNTENVILRCAVQKSPRILGEIWVFWSNIGDLSILVFLTQL